MWDVVYNTYARAQGSFLGWPAEAAKRWGSKPVMLGRGMVGGRCKIVRYHKEIEGQDAQYFVSG